MSRHSAKRLPRAAILIAPLVAAIVLTLFAWPSAQLAPRDLPIAVAGPAAAADAIERDLEQRDGAFDVLRVGDEAAAREAIEDRDVYGAFVATAKGAKLLTASAASPNVARMLEDAAAAHAESAPAAEAAPAEDVVASSPAALALASAVLPLVLAGSVTGVLSGFLTARPLARAGWVVAGSVLAGLAATPIVQDWLGVVEGDWVVNAAALSLTIGAIAATVAGLQSLLGPAGAALGSLTMILIGNPFSGVGSAPELLPRPLGEIGQLMPPGAGGNLLRSTGLFDGAGAGGHATVLAAWALFGLAALALAALRTRRAARVLVPMPA